MNASEPREDAVADSVWEAIRPYIQPSDKSHARVTLTRAIAALAQQGAEPVAWVAFDAKGKPVNLEWCEETSRCRMPAGGSVAPLVQAAPATGAPR